ncbi:serine/threonine-protein kinase ATG1c isoform X2 [Mercurialis annua]|uniref:serine/threonine-protein kinase ATG1c isoform X2 n=1 Tax=Mercurialis annua TaxID=3986 RepID=UPI00215E2A3E|nr:serine/threonine-protein kinase ATG1c isoform X2 [Mercurialis annua]
MMAQAAGGRGRDVVGDYLVGRQIGSGSFSKVYHARHRVHGTEVAIKEIVTSRLNKKLHDSLMSEIFILKRINHHNIICLHDIIEVPGRINIILEFCKGGDLSMYIQRHGRVPEATAKHFMQQLAAGLQVLRDNNLIHRDLKPQNLLLSTNDSNAVLKIADFGFARSLQPRGLAETLCGSPLYMAPEIMQHQKYDAKADLWSVGAILFQLVTGKTPFTGADQFQLLKNIVKSTELPFAPDNKDLSAECKDLCQKLLRRNPVERLTFDEFFNHPFLSPKKVDESSRNRRFSTPVDSFLSSESKLVRQTEEISPEDCLPFFLDDDSSGPDGSPSSLKKKSSLNSTYSSTRINLENTSSKPNVSKIRDENLHEASKSVNQRSIDARSRVADSLESIDQDYVLVSGPPLNVSSSSASTSKPSHIGPKSHNSSPAAVNFNTAPMQISGTVDSNLCPVGSLGSRSSATRTSQESTDSGDVMEQPSTHCLTRIRSLQQCASAISELVHAKVESDKQLEGFSIQLVILAIWKQALHIRFFCSEMKCSKCSCKFLLHTQAASAIEGSPTRETMRLRRSSSKKHGTPDSEDCPDALPESMTAQIERAFLREVEHAEELAKTIEPGNVEMPDAMETIYQSALALGRHGGVQELMGEMEGASFLYTKAVRLLVFLLVEAPSLILNPPFSLTNSDRYRLRTYIDFLNNRQGHSRSQRMALLKCEELQYPPEDTQNSYSQ